MSKPNYEDDRLVASALLEAAVRYNDVVPKAQKLGLTVRTEVPTGAMVSPLVSRGIKL